MGSSLTSPASASPASTCSKCGEQLQVGSWPFCKGGHAPARCGRAQSFTPIVVHVAKDGSIRFPGRGDAKVPKGYQRQELTTLSEIAKFEHKMNAHERTRMSEHLINEEKAYSATYAQNRSELREAMRHMTPLGRAVAEAAIRRNNTDAKMSSDPGFHIEVAHFDANNMPYAD